MELNEQLAEKNSANPTQGKETQFRMVVAQSMVLNSIFPLDSIITAMGMIT